MKSVIHYIDSQLLQNLIFGTWNLAIHCYKTQFIYCIYWVGINHVFLFCWVVGINRTFRCIDNVSLSEELLGFVCNNQWRYGTADWRTVQIYMDRGSGGGSTVAEALLIKIIELQGLQSRFPKSELNLRNAEKLIAQ